MEIEGKYSEGGRERDVREVMSTAVLTLPFTSRDAINLFLFFIGSWISELWLILVLTFSIIVCHFETKTKKSSGTES